MWIGKVRKAAEGHGVKCRMFSQIRQLFQGTRGTMMVRAIITDIKPQNTQSQPREEMGKNDLFTEQETKLCPRSHSCR